MYSIDQFSVENIVLFSVGLLSKIPIASEKRKGCQWLDSAVAAVLMLWLLGPRHVMVRRPSVALEAASIQATTIMICSTPSCLFKNERCKYF
jgi:hypothetical protein